MSPERRNDLPRGPKTSPGGPPTLLRDTKSLPSALGDLPDAPRSAPSGAQPSLPGPPGSSPAFKKPMFSLRKTNNSQLSAPSRGSPAQDPDLALNGTPYYPQPPGPQALFLLPLEGQTSSCTPTPRPSRGRRTEWACAHCRRPRGAELFATSDPSPSS